MKLLAKLPRGRGERRGDGEEKGGPELESGRRVGRAGEGRETGVVAELKV